MHKALKLEISEDKKSAKLVTFELQEGLQPLYDAIGCECFTLAPAPFDFFDCYVDDNSLLVEGNLSYFKIGKEGQPLFGGAVFIGKNDEGYPTSLTDAQIVDIHMHVIFHPEPFVVI